MLSARAIASRQPASPIGVGNCTLYVSADAFRTLVNVAGTATWEIEIPNNSFLIGLPIYVQGAVIDFGINPANIVVTNAVEAVIGGWGR